MSIIEKAVNIILQVTKPEKVILFGSQVNGTANKNSDFDFLVINKNETNPRLISKKIYRALYNIGAPIDIIVVDSKKFEELKFNKNLVYSDAYKFGKTVYESH